MNCIGITSSFGKPPAFVSQVLCMALVAVLRGKVFMKSGRLIQDKTVGKLRRPIDYHKLDSRSTAQTCGNGRGLVCWNDGNFGVTRTPSVTVAPSDRIGPGRWERPRPRNSMFRLRQMCWSGRRSSREDSTKSARYRRCWKSLGN